MDWNVSAAAVVWESLRFLSGTIKSHRRDAKVAELKIFFFFAVERTANQKQPFMKKIYAPASRCILFSGLSPENKKKNLSATFASLR
jgi:hypothetical protein